MLTEYSSFVRCERCEGRVPLSNWALLENDGRLMLHHMKCENGHPFHIYNETADNKLAQAPGTGQWPCNCALGHVRPSSR